MTSLKVSCPPDLREWIRERARRESRSESSVVREALYAEKRRREDATYGRNAYDAVTVPGASQSSTPR